MTLSKCVVRLRPHLAPCNDVCWLQTENLFCEHCGSLRLWGSLCSKLSNTGFTQRPTRFAKTGRKSCCGRGHWPLSTKAPTVKKAVQKSKAASIKLTLAAVGLDAFKIARVLHEQFLALQRTAIRQRGILARGDRSKAPQ